MDPFGRPLNSTTPYATDYRGFARAKITSVNSPASGPLSGKTVYGWTEQSFDGATGSWADATDPRKGVYTSATQFDCVLIDANGHTFSVGDYVWCRMMGVVAGMTVYESCVPAAAAAVCFHVVTDVACNADGSLSVTTKYVTITGVGLTVSLGDTPCPSGSGG